MGWMAGAHLLTDNIVQIGQNVNDFSVLPFMHDGSNCTSNACPFRRTLVMFLW